MPRSSSAGAYTLLEVLVSLAILMAGVLAIIYIFPRTLETRNEAAYLTTAALLAREKVEEIRRDDDTSATMVNAISSLMSPTAPITFPQEPNLTYSFSGKSVLYPDDGRPQGQLGVARVIIRYSKKYRPSSTNPDGTPIYELRFGS